MPIRPIADILAEATANGAPSSSVDMVRTAATMAVNGNYLVRDQLSGALAGLEGVGIDPADIKSLFARCARPKRTPKADGGGKRRAEKGGKPNTPADVAAPVATDTPAAPAPVAAPVEIPADGLPIPRQWAETLCDSEEAAAQAISRTAAGRLAFIHKLGDWLTFGPRGWQPVHKTTLEEACADFARLHIGTEDKESGDLRMAPRSTGRKSVGRAITQLLEPMCGTEFADWDTAPNMIMLPDGVLLNVFTGARRQSEPADRIRRRVPVAPANESEYNRSVFRRVIEHVVPAPDERAYLQRRLGAALVDAEGMDDLIWLYGPPGIGKGTLLHALAQTFGDYGKGVPVNELVKGVSHNSHPAWKARLAGARILFADDVRPGHQLEDTTINLLLGSIITAHHMRQESFDFRLNAPLIVTSNGAPLQATSNVRRLKPIECGPEAEPEDPAIRAGMSTPRERAACLYWLIVGSAGWKREGCAVPESIRARARDVADNAPVVAFTRSYEASARVPSGEVWESWQRFAQSYGHGGLARNQTALAVLLKADGWQPSKSNGVRYLTAPDSVQGSGRVGSPIDAYKRKKESCASTINNPTLPDPAPGETPPVDLPAGALNDPANGGGDQGAAHPLDTRPENPTIPPPGQAKEEQTMPDDHPAAPVDVSSARGDDPPAPSATLTAAEIERLRALPAAAGLQCSPLGKIRAMQTAFGLPLTSWNEDKAAQRGAARATLAAYVDAARRYSTEQNPS